MSVMQTGGKLEMDNFLEMQGNFRFGIAGDFHCKENDSKTVRQLKAVDHNFKLLHEAKDKYNLDGLIFTGDICHSPYANIENLKRDEMKFKALNRKYNDMMFTVLGNHFINFEKKNHLTTYLTHPLLTNDYRSFLDMDDGLIDTGETPVIKALDGLLINDSVLFSFFHFNKNLKYYKFEMDSDTRSKLTHIGVYHDNILPKVQNPSREDNLFSRHFNQTRFDNVDIAIVGHVHKKTDATILTAGNGQKTAFLCPGSMLPTNRNEHADNKFPFYILDIKGDRVNLEVEELELLHRKVTHKKDVIEQEIIMSNIKNEIKEFDSTVIAGSFEEFVNKQEIDFNTKQLLLRIMCEHVTLEEIGGISNVSRENGTFGASEISF